MFDKATKDLLTIKQKNRESFFKYRTVRKISDNYDQIMDFCGKLLLRRFPDSLLLYRKLFEKKIILEQYVKMTK